MGPRSAVRPAARRPSARFRAAALAVLLGTALGGCGGDEEITMPPLTPEPGDERPGTTAAAAPTRAARVVLYKYLRGIAAGDPGACAHLAPAYERATFGGAGACRTGLARARSALRPQDLTALRGVTVPTATAGPEEGEVTVQFEELRWKTAPARPGGVLASSFTLRRNGGRWLVTA
ncbi:hypothetical protein ACFY4C_06560 [Actinomadura viridis]|uniref:hypothetical protein n=1 Tax=Actinomadura viridis TaxID=58110 RepID=UPI00367A70C4